MICKISTVKDCEFLSARIPEKVAGHLKHCINILDEAYGKERNAYKRGGYVIFVDTIYDIEDVQEMLIDKLSEWVEVIEGYLIELYLLGDDFSIILCYPKSLKEKE